MAAPRIDEIQRESRADADDTDRTPVHQMMGADDPCQPVRTEPPRLHVTRSHAGDTASRHEERWRDAGALSGRGSKESVDARTCDAHHQDAVESSRAAEQTTSEVLTFPAGMRSCALVAEPP